MKIYLLVKESYGDFDSLHEEIIGANQSQKIVDTLVLEYNAMRTDEEIRNEVEYTKKTVSIIYE